MEKERRKKGEKETDGEEKERPYLKRNSSLAEPRMKTSSFLKFVCVQCDLSSEPSSR